MQDIHSFGGGNRLFSGEGGDRRLRPHNLQNHQALKCPRCDSLSTKFCYYNNYNLSQPRHFCKSCRRYWTRGGVLRNVPVGGGCRKTKRSKPKQVASENAATGDNTLPPEETKPSVSHSSSESSSLTAVAVSGGLEAVSTAKNGESELFVNGIFSEIESLTSLVTSSRDSHVPFGFGNVLTQQSVENNVQENLRDDHQKMPETAEGLVAPATMNGSLFESLDWHGGGDHGGLFDFPTTGVDQTYWTQSQWTYLP